MSLPNGISQFLVCGLHGDRNVTLDFSAPATIINADNGSGKTTVLNLLFRLLSGDILGLFQSKFESVSIVFSDGDSAKIDTIPIYELEGFRRLFRHLERYGDKLSIDQQYQIARIITSYEDPQYIEDHPFIRQIARSSRTSRSVIVREILRWRRSADEDENNLFTPALNQEIHKIREKIPYPILYLPTYRRIEEDISSLR